MLLVLAIALPFLFFYTAPPYTNFWPLMAAWLCGWVVSTVWAIRGLCMRRNETMQTTDPEIAPQIAGGLLLAALLARMKLGSDSN